MKSEIKKLELQYSLNENLYKAAKKFINECGESGKGIFKEITLLKFYNNMMDSKRQLLRMKHRVG